MTKWLNVNVCVCVCVSWLWLALIFKGAMARDLPVSCTERQKCAFYFSCTWHFKHLKSHLREIRNVPGILSTARARGRVLCHGDSEKWSSFLSAPMLTAFSAFHSALPEFRATNNLLGDAIWVEWPKVLRIKTACWCVFLRLSFNLIISLRWTMILLQYMLPHKVVDLSLSLSLSLFYGASEPLSKHICADTFILPHTLST